MNAQRMLQWMGLVTGTLLCGRPVWGSLTGPSHIAAGTAATAGSVGRFRADSITAFVDVSVIPMDRERTLPHQTVVVRGTRIVALGPVRRIRVPAGAVWIDGRGQFLIPGLSNMHAHFDQVDTAPSPPRIERMLLAFLRDGYTTVRNMDGRPWHVTLREQVARGELLGPRIYTAGPAGPSFRSDRPVTTPAEAVQVVAAHQAAGYDFLKLYGLYGTDGEMFDSLVAAAARGHLPVAGHAPARPDGVERMLQAHAASIEHLTGYIEYLSGTSNRFDVATMRGQFDEAKLVAIAHATQRAGVWNCPTFAVVSGSLKDRRKPTIEYPGMAKIVSALHDAGAGLLLGTDANPTMDWIPVEWELQMLVLAGLTPYEALVTGTRNVAQFFGTLDSVGTVAVGKRADLVLLMGNPLKKVENVGRQAGVMVNGRWVARSALEARLQVLAQMFGPLPAWATDTTVAAP